MDQIDTIEKLETKLKYCVKDEDQICSLLKKKKKKTFCPKTIACKTANMCSFSVVLFYFIIIKSQKVLSFYLLIVLNSYL